MWPCWPLCLVISFLLRADAQNFCRKWTVRKEKASTAPLSPKILTFFYHLKWFEKKQNLPFSQPRLPIPLFFVPNPYTAPLPSLLFLERQRRGRKKCIAEIIYPNTFNEPKKETVDGNCVPRVGVGGGKGGSTMAPTSGGAHTPRDLRCIPAMWLGPSLPLSTLFLSRVLKVTWPPHRLSEKARCLQVKQDGIWYLLGCMDLQGGGNRKARQVFFLGSVWAWEEGNKEHHWTTENLFS